MKYKIKTLQKKTFVIFPSKLNLAPGIGLPRVWQNKTWAIPLPH